MAPKFRVGANVVSFTSILVLSTVGAVAYSRLFGASDEEKEKALREKYPVDPRLAEVRRQNMQNHFNKMKDRSGDVDAKVDEILKAGKGGMKRHYPLETTPQSMESSTTPQSTVSSISSSPKTTTSAVAFQSGTASPAQAASMLGSWWAWWNGDNRS